MGSGEHEFTAFYDATWARTVACAYAVTGDLGAAEDLAQEADSRAWPRWSTLATYDDPGAWVRQVATRQAISRGHARLDLGVVGIELGQLAPPQRACSPLSEELSGPRRHEPRPRQWQPLLRGRRRVLGWPPCSISKPQQLPWPASGPP